MTRLTGFALLLLALALALTHPTATPNGAAVIAIVGALIAAHDLTKEN